jgi:MFS superfamily sulfate permease-like transporter
LGIKLDEAQVIEKIMALPGRISDSHLLTVRDITFNVSYFNGIKTYRSHWPAPLIAIVITTALVWGPCTTVWDCHYWGEGFQPGLPVVNWAAFQPGRCVI